ncbi:unnamed protein product [Aphanomyces euteiches]
MSKEQKPIVTDNAVSSEYDPMLEESGAASDDKRDMNSASFLFMVLGFGYLFPYHALAQPVDYWHHLFPTFEVDFEISWAYNIASVTTLFLIVWLGGKQWYTGRIVGGFIVQVVVLAVLPASYFVLKNETQNLVMVLGSAVVVAIATSFLDSSVFSLANLFPSGGIESVQLGMGFSMVVTSFYRLVTKAFFSSSMVVEATMLYFFVGAITVGCGIFAYYQLLRLPMTSRCLSYATQDIVRMSLVKKIWAQELMVTLTYATSLAIWPGVISVIPSYNFPQLNKSGWWPLLLLSLYSVSELIGRYLVRYRGGITAKSVWTLVVPRIVLIPLAICCAQGVPGFTHDAVSIAVSVITAVSAGYVGTVSIIVVNDCVEVEEQSATGMLSSFFLNIGLILGSSGGFVIASVFGL